MTSQLGRRRTWTTEEQERAIVLRDPPKNYTLQQIADELDIHKSAVQRMLTAADYAPLDTRILRKMIPAFARAGLSVDLTELEIERIQEVANEVMV